MKTQINLNSLLATALIMSILAITAGPSWAIPRKPSEWALDNLDRMTLRQLKKEYGFGPYPQEIEAFVSDKPETLVPQYEALYRGGTRNAALNYLRIGLIAFENGDYERAEVVIDEALSRIEAVYADNPKAAEARSLWSKESIKDWKGEPYERAMAYYYRGLLYLREGDYENARASFRQAEFQDTVAEQETFQSDFALMNYLAGWASQCANDPVLAREYYTLAQQHSPHLRMPAATDNLLVLAETGTSPRKLAAGNHNEELRFEPGTGDDFDSVTFRIDGDTEVPVAELSSVGFQATTRGGRAVQSILDGKARFKSVTAGVGQFGQNMGAAAVYAGYGNNNSDLAGAGAIVAGAGMLFSAISNRAKPDADTRYWDNLPNSVRSGTAVLAEYPETVTAEYDGEVRPAAVVSEPGLSCVLAWSRSHSAASVDSAAPNTALSKREQRRMRKAFGDQDRQFRAALIGQID